MKKEFLHVSIWALAFAASLGVLPALVGACSSDASDTTTGKRVKLATHVETDTLDFTTGTGWHVVLDHAAVGVGALYYFDGEPAFVMNTPRGDNKSRWAAIFGLSPAFAHPGHYQAGNALGQMLESSSVDLTTLPTDLGVGTGITGTFRSARFVFAETPVGPAAAELGKHAAVAEGTASMDADGGTTEIHFHVVAEFADIAKSAANGQVDGCTFDETNVEDDGTVTLELSPSVWFNLVDFTGVAPGTADAPTELSAGTTPHTAFALGLAQLSAYHFSYSK